jgi:hypothetical protein
MMVVGPSRKVSRVASSFEGILGGGVEDGGYLFLVNGSILSERI